MQSPFKSLSEVKAGEPAVVEKEAAATINDTLASGGRSFKFDGNVGIMDAVRCAIDHAGGWRTSVIARDGRNGLFRVYEDPDVPRAAAGSPIASLADTKRRASEFVAKAAAKMQPKIDGGQRVFVEAIGLVEDICEAINAAKGWRATVGERGDDFAEILIDEVPDPAADATTAPN